LTWSDDDHSEVTFRLKRPIANGKTTMQMKPVDLLRRLAGVVPPPRVHQIHYFGGFSSHSNLRRRIVARSPKGRRRCRMDDACIEQRALPLPAPVVPGGEPEALPLINAPAPRARELDWRALLRRTFATELFDCACGGRRRVVAFVSDPEKAVEVLGKLGLPTEPPRLERARAPPVQEELFPPAPEIFADPIYPDA